MHILGLCGAGSALHCTSRRAVENGGVAETGNPCIVVFVNKDVCLKHNLDVSRVTRASEWEGVPNRGFHARRPGHACGSNLELFPSTGSKQGEKVGER